MKTVAGYWLLVAGSILMVSCTSQKTEYVVGVGEKIFHAEYEYCVTSYMVTRFLRDGRDTIHARGMFYVVRFRVDNKAEKGSHSWDNSIAYIVDDKAGTFGNLSEIQNAVQRIEPFGLKEKYNTPAGSSDSTCLVFDLPFNVTKPYLKIKGDLLFRDYFDGALFRRVRVQLF